MLRPVHTLPLIAVALGKNADEAVALHMAPLVIVAGPPRERRASVDLR